MGDTDSLGYVRFVLSGECVILQCLSMKVSTTLQFKLLDIYRINSFFT